MKFSDPFKILTTNERSATAKSQIDVSQFQNEKVFLKKFNAYELKEIVFNDIEGKLPKEYIYIIFSLK